MPQDPKLATLLAKLAQLDEQVESHCNQLLLMLHELRGILYDMVNDPQPPS